MWKRYQQDEGKAQEEAFSGHWKLREVLLAALLAGALCAAGRGWAGQLQLVPAIFSDVTAWPLQHTKPQPRCITAQGRLCSCAQQNHLKQSKNLRNSSVEMGQKISKIGKK